MGSLNSTWKKAVTVAAGLALAYAWLAADDDSVGIDSSKPGYAQRQKGACDRVSNPNSRVSIPCYAPAK